MFLYLRQRWATLCGARFDILLYDLAYARNWCSGPTTRYTVVESQVHTPAGEIQLPPASHAVTRQSFTFRLKRAKWQAAERRDGHYLLRSNLVAADPAVLWERYAQLTQIEAAFKSLKSELGLRPIYHQLEHRVEAHIFVAFLAYCLLVTLKHRVQAYAPGLTPRALLEKLASLQMLDVYLPTTDGRWLVLPRYTQSEPPQKLLLHHLKLSLPAQPPSRIRLRPDAASPPEPLRLSWRPTRDLQ